MASKTNSSTNVKRLVVTAMLIALGTVLSMIKIWEMPLGGSITLLSMLPITLISIEYGVGWGLGGAFVCAMLQMALSFSQVLSWGLSPLAVVGCLLFDYAIAFTVLGFAGLFRKKGVPGICAGVATALVLRFICHIVSGVLIFGSWLPEGWGNPLIYSICYNGAYMLPELVLTMAGTIILFKIPGFNKLIAGNAE